ncbi:hypothetical protein G6F64_015498 [Rhizopus arrhizus]|uniref:Uncharacterized protein n=1 Tax=Rhizopus oryzae TaxID=64495 RepID=A0A9P7BIS6_RHIOR|nr:hypothetical protein G6F64_015498 [Rhizopus arrhizus]
MWKIAQMEPARMWPIPKPMLAPLKPVQAPPRRAISMKISSPANMLPNNRMPSDTDLAEYSIRFSSRLNGASTTAPRPCAWNGAVNSSLTKPPGCLILMP